MDLSAILFLIGIIACCGRLILVDVRRFEIEFETLTLLFLLLLGFSIWNESATTTCIRLVSGFLFLVSFLLLKRVIPSMARFGLGDIPLVAVLAFMVTPLLVPFALIAAVLCLVTARVYAWRRGKPGLRSIFPAALPLVTAALIMFLAMEVGGELAASTSWVKAEPWGFWGMDWAFS